MYNIYNLFISIYSNTGNTYIYIYIYISVCVCVCVCVCARAYRLKRVCCRTSTNASTYNFF